MLALVRMTARKHIPNPTGKNGRDPKAQELRALARTHTEEAVNVIALVMHTSDDESLQLEAAGMLLDRGWGKPSQAIDLMKYEAEQIRNLPLDELLALAPTALRMLQGDDDDNMDADHG